MLFFSVLFRADLVSEAEIVASIHDISGECFKFYPQHNPLKNYYAQEMRDQDHLERLFLVPVALFPREFLLSTKLLAQTWEKQWAENSRRKVNVDVGFITPENFVLATTKNYSHRIFLGQGIFADLTYEFSAGAFRPLPWCYPDYQDQEKIDFLSWCRSYLLISKSNH